MLRIVCLLLLFAGACTMSASILIYRKTIKKYAGYLSSGVKFALNRYNFILILMIFFLIGYLATLFYLFELDTVNMSLLLIAVIFFFGAIFCYSVVFVQSDLLNRLEENADMLRKAFEESKKANLSLEGLNKELVSAMAALKSAQDQLIFSEKMSALGELMVGVSHEINTPICAVQASAQSLNSSFSEHFSKLFCEIRQLSDTDFEHYQHYAKIAILNTRSFTSTAETRALKRKAKQTLEQVDGFNNAILDMLARNALLDSDTITSLIPLLPSETFAKILRLTSETVSIVNSIDIISQASERVIKMVSSLKSFSHFNADSEKISFNLISGIESVLVIYANQLKYDVEVVTDFEDVPNLTGYQDELGQVWSNLIQNAIYAMHDGNTLPPESRRPPKLVITVKSTDNDQISVSIADNGCGINPEKASKIFEPFYTTKPTGIGTGLGLSISKQIIDKHNGTIRVESNEGHGTAFIVTFPV